MADASITLPMLGAQLGLTRMPDGTYATNTAFVGGASDSLGATVSRAVATTSPVVLLATNGLRRGSPSVYYDGAAQMFLLAGLGTPSATNFTVILGQGYGTYWAPDVLAYTGPVSAVWSSAVGAAQVTEYV